ncbi:hypothetical protein ACVWZT_003588 [Pseudomonas sp. TE21394]
MVRISLQPSNRSFLSNSRLHLRIWTTMVFIAAFSEQDRLTKLRLTKGFDWPIGSGLER